MGMTLTLDDLKTALLMPRELAAGFILQYTVSTPPYLVDNCGFKWIKIHINNKTILFSSTLSMSRLFSLQVTMALWISTCKSWWIFYSLVLIFGNHKVFSCIICFATPCATKIQSKWFMYRWCHCQDFLWASCWNYQPIMLLDWF